MQGLPQLLSLVISDAQGMELYRSRAADHDPNPNISDRSYFVAQRDNPDLGFFVSEPIVSRAHGRRAIVLSRRLADSGGRFAGVVAGVIDLDYLQQFYRQIQLGTRSAILLFRDDGTLLLREPPSPGQVGMTFPSYTNWLSSLGATRVVASIDGVPRFVAGAHASGFPLIVAGRFTTALSALTAHIQANASTLLSRPCVG